MKELLRKTKARLVMQYFLRRLQLRMEADRVNVLDSIFLSIYTKDELLDIINWTFVPTVPQKLDYDQMSKEELLQVIGDDYYILSYEIEQARMELFESKRATPQIVRRTLEQLGLHSHYLMQKPVTDWDEYDCANYKSLSYKAGNPTPLFGIYDISVMEEDKYIVTTPPSKFYNSEEEANQALGKMIKKGELQKGEAKIMML